MLALLALGLFVAAIARTGNAATGIGLFVFFPSLFLSGVGLPVEAMPPVIATISNHSPLGAAMGGLREAWSGSYPDWRHLGAMALAAVVCSVAAIRLFRVRADESG